MTTDKLIQIKDYPGYMYHPEDEYVMSYKSTSAGHPLQWIGPDKISSAERQERCIVPDDRGNYPASDCLKFVRLYRKDDMGVTRSKLFSLSDLRSLSHYFKQNERKSEMTGQFIIGSITKSNGAFSVASNPARHLTAQAAKTEAASLARNMPEKKFVVLRIEAVATVNEVTWE